MFVFKNVTKINVTALCILIILVLLFLSPTIEVKAELRTDHKELFVNSLIMKCNSEKAYTRSINTLIDYQNIDVRPYAKSDVTYVPLRFLVEHQGGRIRWNSAENRINFYMNNKTYDLYNGEVFLEGEKINLTDSFEFRDGRWYVPIVEWNEKFLGQKLVLHNQYIILTSHQYAIPDDFYNMLDQYYSFCVEDEFLMPIRTNSLFGLINIKGEIVFKPEYQLIRYSQHKPILVKKSGLGEWAVMTSQKKISKIKTDADLYWVNGNCELLIGYIGSFIGQGGPVVIYDIMGEKIVERVGEELVDYDMSLDSVQFAYCNGLKAEIDENGNYLLKNLSGNVLFSASLPENLKFTTKVENDHLVIATKDNRRWGYLDFDGNLIPSENNDVVDTMPKPIVHVKRELELRFDEETQNYSCYDMDGNLLYDNGKNYMGWMSKEYGIIEFDTDTNTGYMNTDFEVIYLFDKTQRYNPMLPPG